MKGAPSSPLVPAAWVFFLSAKSGLRSGRALVPGEEWVRAGQGMDSWAGCWGSVESTAPQIFGNDDVRHGVKDKLDVVGVRSTGDVGVDLFVG